MIARLDPQTIVELGDQIVLIGTHDELRKLDRVFQRVAAASSGNE